MSRVDVVIPCYNYGHFLRECVTSVLMQEGVDVRVLIIDDCSPDNTPEVGRQLAAEDSRVEYRRHEVNRGHIATYNEGLLEWAGGDYCILLSADDRLTPGAFARAAKVMDENPGVSFVYGRVIMFDSDGPMPAPASASPCKLQIVPGEEWVDRACMKCINSIASPEVMVRTRLQKEVGGYRTELPDTGDFEMWLRLASRGDVGIVDADQAYYRIHAKNMHHTLENTKLAFLRHMWSAFDSYFRLGTPEGTDSTALRKRVERNLIEATLGAAYHAFEAGDVSGCRELLDFSTKLSPEARELKAHSRIKWKLRIGPAAFKLVRQLKPRGMSRQSS